MGLDGREGVIVIRPMLALFKHWHPRLDRWVQPGEKLPGLWMATMGGKDCGADCWIDAMDLVLWHDMVRGMAQGDAK